MSNLKPLKDRKAWKILTMDEKTALSLSFGQKKSTWQGGEVMNKSHYKYLEIMQRGRFFLQYFDAYFDKHHNLFYPLSPVDDRFQCYIRYAITERLPMKLIMDKMDDHSLSTLDERREFIIENMAALKDSKIPWDNDTYDLIVEFDRWNNFRILPGEIQSPSAFKRRNKHRDKRLLKLTSQWNQLSINNIEKRFGLKGSSEKLKIEIIYVVLISTNLTRRIIRMRATQKEEATKMNLFAFKNITTATRFAEICTGYLKKEIKHCKEGQKFWPQFREFIKHSVNYDDLLNLSPFRGKMVEEMDEIKL